MAQETLNRIREAELAAKQVVKDSQDLGAQIIAEAKEEVKQYREDLLTRSRRDAKAALQKAEDQMNPALEAADVRANAVITQFGKNLDSKKEEALQLVINHII